jgi:hypothetical protein
MWRSHPVRFAALLGGIFGIAYALVIEIGGASNRNSSAVVRMLLPATGLSPALNQFSLVRAALLLLIEFGADALVYALIFAAPVGVVVLVRRAFANRARGSQ